MPIPGRICIDSREVREGDLFAAYRGEHTDGHRFIGKAFENGAACCLAEEIPAGEVRPVILVENVQQALEYHSEILDAVKRHDCEAAYQLMREHIETVSDRISTGRMQPEAAGEGKEK